MEFLGFIGYLFVKNDLRRNNAEIAAHAEYATNDTEKPILEN